MYKCKSDIHAHVSHDNYTETIENVLTSKVLLGFIYDSQNT